MAVAHKHMVRFKEKKLTSGAVFASHLPRISIFNGNNGKIKLMLRVTVLRLLRMQPNEDTLICIETYEGNLGPS